MWMELESIMLTEISWSEKDKYHIISLMCGTTTTKNPKQMSKGGKRERGKQTKKQTLNYREQTDGYQRGGERVDG